MWIYSISTGRITRDEIFLGLAYSGNDKLGICKNNPFAIAVKDHGPLPIGFYIMEEIVEGTHMGPFAIKLKPDPSNDMFGRSEFFIHGDNGLGTASDGCPCTSLDNRKLMWNSDEHQFQVIA